MSELHFFDFPRHDGMEEMGPEPANLKRIRATGQNTLALHDGEPVLVRAPMAAGGPAVWTWQLMNVGPGVLFARWDGRGYAEADDENSLRLQAGIGFSGIRAGMLTLACQGATFATFTAENLPGRE